MGNNDRMKESIKDNKEVLDSESNEEEIKEISKVDSKDLKLKESDMISQGISEEKTESKWKKIDWSKNTSEEKKENTKWGNIDWNKDT